MRALQLFTAYTLYLWCHLTLLQSPKKKNLSLSLVSCLGIYSAASIHFHFSIRHFPQLISTSCNCSREMSKAPATNQDCLFIKTRLRKSALKHFIFLSVRCGCAKVFCICRWWSAGDPCQGSCVDDASSTQLYHAARSKAGRAPRTLDYVHLQWN